MVSYGPTPWRELLDAVLKAPDLLSAQIATANLIDAALPGGSAQAVGAADLMVEIRTTSGLDRHPFRAYVIAVVLQMATWPRSWRMSEPTGKHVNASLAAESERIAEEHMVAFCSDLIALVDDVDAEVRAMMYLLVGAVGKPESEAIALLQRKTEVESNALAGACAVQAVVKVISRLPGDDADTAAAAAWVRHRLAPKAVATNARVWQELESIARTPREQDRLRAVVGLNLTEDVAVVPEWDAERV